MEHAREYEDQFYHRNQFARAILMGSTQVYKYVNVVMHNARMNKRQRTKTVATECARRIHFARMFGLHCWRRHACM